jgi:hypothetical protein
MQSSHVGCGYNLEQSKASMSGRIFVLSFTGNPLTPCKPQKARKLILGRVAVVVWNKFGQFGIQMLVQTREFVPKTILGIDFGTKFEGYSLISGNENLLNVMWLLPNKENLVIKMEERRNMRKSRRQRNCRRREVRFDNRKKDGFIAPSQLMIILSRLKCIKEIIRTYPVSDVVIEDVKFNHRKKKYGRNFSTIETGKNMIYCFIKEKINLKLFTGRDTKRFREEICLVKSTNKSVENFNSHCVDSFALAYQLSKSKPNYNMLIVDDTYRPFRRKLHYTQPAKGNVRKKYSTGNFRGVRKGTICELGQICGGKKNYFMIMPYVNRLTKEKRIEKSIKKISWLSHNFKVRKVMEEEDD